jgi:hypothetical protein
MCSIFLAITIGKSSDRKLAPRACAMNYWRLLSAYASEEAAARRDRRLSRFYFDMSGVAGLGNWKDRVDVIVARIPQLGVERVLSPSWRRIGVHFERSLPDATHGNGHVLLALGLTIDRLTALAEVIQRGGDRIVFGYRPVKSVCLQPVVLSINGAIATQHGIEA